ncbi:MAG: tetratricopeptide repeat protein, partial [Anaerolineales bacterium]|nr:tetratricopeptide repeat protein [Anaerolineales bacterium]
DELFSLCQKNGSRVIRGEDVEAVIEDVIERGTVNLKFVWDEASDLEKWVLACLAQLDRGVSNQDLASLLREQRVRFVESDLNSAVLHLREKDVIAKDNTFVVYLMRLWLEQNRPLDRVREELTEVNPIANRFIEIGDEYRDRGDYQSALESYQQALGADPRNLRANLNLAQTYLQNAKYQEAIESFQKALNIDPEDIAAQTGLCDAYLALGHQERREGNQQGAVDYYQKVLTFNESHADARQGLAEIYRGRAEKYLSDGKDDQALQAYNRALEYTPEDEELSARYEDVLAQKKAAVIREWLKKADRALNRQQWDAAVEAVENALEIDPENESLQRRLLEAKDASRQHQLGVYQNQVDRARAKGAWDEAIGTLQKAIQLAPDEDTFKEQLGEVQEARRQAQLDEFQRRADRALGEEDWDAAKQALQGAAELDPENPQWEKQIEEVEKKRFQAQLEELRSRAERAKEEENWGSAIAALEEFLELEPSQEIQDEIEELKARQRQSQLAGLKRKAEKAELEERWPAAIDAWQAYLSLDPEDTLAAEKALQRAQKYEQIYADYEQAKDSLRQKRYGQAVELLQGIIAQDPTYKATSRLLVEAVEARQSIPLWRKTWVYMILGGILSAALAVVFLPRVTASGWIDEISLPSFFRSPTPSPTALPPTATPDPVQAFADTVFSNIKERSPDFEDDFSERKSEWGFVVTNTKNSSDVIMGEYIRNAAFVLDRSDWADIDSEIEVQLGTTAKAETNIDGKTPLKGEDFVLEYWLLPGELGEDDEFNLIIRALDHQNLYRIPLANVIRRSDVIDSEAWNLFQVITYEQDVMIYVNQTLLTRLEGIEPLGDEVFFEFTAGSGSGFHISLDSIKFWRLEEGLVGGLIPTETTEAGSEEEAAAVDTQSPTPTVTPTPDLTALDLDTIPDDLQPLISYINYEKPTFSDDFSTAKDEWGNFENYYGREDEREMPTQHISHVVSSGVLHVQGNSEFPQTDLFQAENFILEFEYDIKSRMTGIRNYGHGGIAVAFRGDNSGS